MDKQTGFFKQLIAAGIRLPDAEELEAAYPNQPDFLDGLEQVAAVLALRELPTQLPPTGEPWHTLLEAMLQDIGAGQDYDEAFRTALGTQDPAVRGSISNAVSVRMQAIIDFEASRGRRKRVKSRDYINGLRSLGYDFRLNECGYVVEVNGQPMSDDLNATIQMQMRDAGYHRMDEMQDVIKAYAYQNRYHPVRDYLLGLSFEGGTPIADLANHFTNPDGMFGTWLRKWLIGACSKVFEQTFNPVLVLDGPQGIGKSKFAQWLGAPLTQYWHEGAINPDDKDCRLRLGAVWIWEVSELGSTTRRQDIEALKSFISLSTVRDRKPYGRYDTVLPVMASMIGTVNNISGIYADPTGNRRFLTCRIEAVDWRAYTTQVDVNQVWAEAMVAYLSYEPFSLSKEELTKAQEMNEIYEIEDPIEGILKKHFDVDPERADWWLPTADILQVLEDPYKGAVRGTTKSNSMALSAVMARLGCHKIKGKNQNGQRVWGYQGVRFTMVPIP